MTPAGAGQGKGKSERALPLLLEGDEEWGEQELQGEFLEDLTSKGNEDSTSHTHLVHVGGERLRKFRDYSNLFWSRWCLSRRAVQ